jgi:hypothetical protein
MAQSSFPISIFTYANTLPVANGYIVIQTNKDVQIPSTGQISSRIKVTVRLDQFGQILNDPVFWPNSELNPNDSYYIYSVYTVLGQRIVGPEAIQIGIGLTGFGQSFGSSFAS